MLWPAPPPVESPLLSIGVAIGGNGVWSHLATYVSDVRKIALNGCQELRTGASGGEARLRYGV